MADFTLVTPVAFRTELDKTVDSAEIRHIVKLTQVQYDAIVTPDPETLYMIEG